MTGGSQDLVGERINPLAFDVLDSLYMTEEVVCSDGLSSEKQTAYQKE